MFYADPALSATVLGYVERDASGAAAIGGGKKACCHHATVDLIDSDLERILDLTTVGSPHPTIERRMDRYSLDEPPVEEQNTEETAGSRRAGIVLAVVGVLIMSLAMLCGWTPWSL